MHNTVNVSVARKEPVYTITLETDDLSSVISLVHRLNIGRHRMASARSRVTNPHTGVIEPVGPTYADEYEVTPSDLAARGTPLGVLYNALVEQLAADGVDVSNLPISR